MLVEMIANAMNQRRRRLLKEKAVIRYGVTVFLNNKRRCKMFDKSEGNTVEKLLLKRAINYVTRKSTMSTRKLTLKTLFSPLGKIIA